MCGEIPNQHQEFLIFYLKEENVEFNFVCLAILFHFRDGAYYEIF